MSLLPDLSFLAFLITPPATSSDATPPATTAPITDASLPAAQGHELPRVDDLVFADPLPALNIRAADTADAAAKTTTTGSADANSQAPTATSLDALFGGRTWGLGQGLDDTFDGSDASSDHAAFGGGSLSSASEEQAAGAILAGTIAATGSEAPSVGTSGPAVALAQRDDAGALGAMTAQPTSPASGTESAASVRPPTAESVPSAPALNAAQLHPALSFEANLGQTDAGVNFLAHGQGYTAFLTPTGVTLAAAGADGSETSAQIQLVSSNPDASATGLDLSQAKTNYFIGNDPSQWVTNVPNYGQVSYAGVYPGINLVYHSSKSGGLEYDFQVSPGADPGVIGLRVPGADGLRIAVDGSLVAHTAAGDLVQPAPALYQMGTSGQRQAVDGNFVLRPDNTVGFRVGNYDPAKELIIDPSAVWSTYLGGNAIDVTKAVATDSNGNTYVAGYTNSPLINGVVGKPVGPGGGTDVLVAKLNGAGGLTWLTFLGGGGTDQGYGIAVDPTTENVYLTGATDSNNFPKTAGAYQGALAGLTDAFVTELDASGTTVLFSTYLGGAGWDNGNAIALGVGVGQIGTGDGGTDGTVSQTPPGGGAPLVYVTGDTTSANYPLPAAGMPGQAALGGGQDAFVAELNPTVLNAGNLVYWTYLGGGGTDSGKGIAVLSGNAYVTGFTEGGITTTAPQYEGMPGTPYQGAAPGGRDAFFLEVNATGGFIYLTYLGGPNDDEGHAIAVDGQGNAYITGRAGDQFPTILGTAPLPAYRGGPADAFISMLTPAGGGIGDLVYSTYLGGEGDDEGNGIALGTVSALTTAFVTGDTGSVGFPTVGNWPAWGTKNNGGTDAFLTAVQPGLAVGPWWIFSGYLGGAGTDLGMGIALSGGSAPYTYIIGGQTDSNPFQPIGPLAWQPAFGGGNDGFVTALS